MADFGKYFRAYMYMQDILKNDFTYNYIAEEKICNTTCKR